MGCRYPHNPKVAGSNPAPATMNDEGLADVEAANPFRLPRNHPGIGSLGARSCAGPPARRLARRRPDAVREPERGRGAMARRGPGIEKPAAGSRLRAGDLGTARSRRPHGRSRRVAHTVPPAAVDAEGRVRRTPLPDWWTRMSRAATEEDHGDRSIPEEATHTAPHHLLPTASQESRKKRTLSAKERRSSRPLPGYRCRR